MTDQEDDAVRNLVGRIATLVWTGIRAVPLLLGCLYFAYGAEDAEGFIIQFILGGVFIIAFVYGVKRLGPALKRLGSRIVRKLSRRT